VRGWQHKKKSPQHGSPKPFLDSSSHPTFPVKNMNEVHQRAKTSIA
jgi:hypothetical protein